jgi:hypothetical protein
MINGRIASIASLLLFLMAFRISHSFIHVKKLPNSFFPRHILSLRHLTYDHKTVEGKWQKYWVDHSTFKSTRRLGYPKKYILDMFPYPSGNLSFLWIYFAIYHIHTCRRRTSCRSSRRLYSHRHTIQVLENERL